MEIEKLKFPIGRWNAKKSYTEKDIQRNIAILEKFPAKYKRLVKNLTEEDLAKTYREGSWNIRQLVIHISDMHLIHLTRFKQALCVENPVGFVADIDGWANLSEVHSAKVTDGLLMLEATHKRWAHILKTMKEEDFNRTFYHPARQVHLSLAQALHMGAWHTKHHFEHIRIALNN